MAVAPKALCTTAWALLLVLLGCTTPEVPTAVELRVTYDRPPASLEIRGKLGERSLGPTPLPKSPRALHRDGESVTLLLPRRHETARVVSLEVRALDGDGRLLDSQRIRLELTFRAAVSGEVALRIDSPEPQPSDAAASSDAGEDPGDTGGEEGGPTNPTTASDGSADTGSIGAEIPKEEAQMVTADATMATPAAMDLSDSDKPDASEVVTPGSVTPEEDVHDDLSDNRNEPANGQQQCSITACLDAGDTQDANDPVRPSARPEEDAPSPSGNRPAPKPPAAATDASSAEDQPQGEPPALAPSPPDAGAPPPGDAAPNVPSKRDAAPDSPPPADEDGGNEAEDEEASAGEQEDEETDVDAQKRCDLSCNRQLLSCLIAI